jgi:hypothetical protein
MKRALALLLISIFALPLPAQQSGPTTQTIQMECHDLASTGNYVGPDETVIDGKACRQVAVATKIAAPVGVATPVAAPAPQPEAPVTAVPASVPLPPADAPAPRGFLLEDSTPVHLVLSENLSSASAVTGQTVEFEVVDDIVVNGLLVIPRGSTAWATVTEAEHKRHLGKPGKLDINIDKVRLADGEKALLRAVKDVQGGGHTGAMTGAIVATSLVLWPAAPFFLFMHGKDITIPKGTQLTAFVQGDVRLDANKFQKQLAVTQ